MSYLPAPYESVPQDDLAPPLAAGLAVTLAAITSWVLGRWSYLGLRALIDLTRSGRGSKLPPEVLVPAVGWAAATVFMVAGSLLLAAGRGRGALVFGALVGIGTTVVAQFTFHFGTATHPVAQWPLYWGAGAVLLVALLPATRRWTRRRSIAPAGSVTGQQTIATVWPGT